MKRTGRPWSLRTAATVLSLIVIALISIAASTATRSLLQSEYDTDRTIRLAQILNGRLLTDQLDEETAIRGYAASGHRDFLEPFQPGKRQFSADAFELRHYLTMLGTQAPFTAFDRLVRLNQDWLANIAGPTLASGPNAYNQRRAQHGKTLTDSMRVSSRLIAAALERSSYDQSNATQRAFAVIAVIATVAIMLLGTVILSSAIRLSRLQIALRAERTTVGILQQGFLNRVDMLPNTDIGAVYLSATRGSLVGGDLFDIHRIDDHYGYVLIADVSGKGIEAAIDTAFIKYSIRGLAAIHDPDPAEILRKFSRLLDGHLANPENFVVLFLAVIDLRDRNLIYSSAGHGGAFLRRGAEVRQLDPTGPIIGPMLAQLGEAANVYNTQRVQLQPADLLILTTDGLTEARDPQYEMLADEGTIEWIQQMPIACRAQEAADWLVTQLKQFVQVKFATISPCSLFASIRAKEESHSYFKRDTSWGALHTRFITTNLTV